MLLDQPLEGEAVALLRATYSSSSGSIPVKILIWHGYLLGGTGSNVYTSSLARAWSRLGHEVVVFAQEPHPERFDLGGAAFVRPDAGRMLPVFVLDRYEGLEPRLLPELTAAERDEWVERNAAAVREHLPADLLLVNHVLLGAPVGAATGAPFTVKAHGSEPSSPSAGTRSWRRGRGRASPAPTTFLPARSDIRRVLEEVIGPDGYLDRVRVVPPGVDIDALRPEPRAQALARLVEEARRDPPRVGERYPDHGNAERLEAFLAGDGPTVVFVGS